jgi:S-adenosylmethionine hydrolase
LITLTTDLDEIYVAQMKGSILSLRPDARVVDVSHDEARFDVRRASFSMMCAARAFPPGTIHVCVVDPGVGSVRRAVIADAGEALFVGPDNGVLTLPLSLYERKRYFELDAAEVSGRTGRPVSRTFHGRDLFAPAAAMLDSGVGPEELGSKLYGIQLFPVLEPSLSGGRARGTILFVDGFGNIVTNIPGDLLRAEEGQSLSLELGGKTFPLTSRSCYADSEPGELILLVGSQDTYEVSLNRERAQSAVGGREGDEISLVLEAQG